MKKYWFIGLVMLMVTLAGCGRFPTVAAVEATPTALPQPAVSSAVVAEGNVVPRDFTRIYTRSGGKIAEVLVKKGDVVTKDAVLVRFGDREQAEAALTAAQLEQLSAQQALDRLNQNGDVAKAQAQEAVTSAQKRLIDAQQALADLNVQKYSDDLDKLRQDANTAKNELDDAQKEWDKYKDLDSSNQTRRDQKKRFDDAQKKYDDAVRKRDLKINELDTAQRNADAAQSALDDAQRELARHPSGPNTDDLALAQQRLDNAKAQAAAAQAAIDALEVKAPFDGTIVELDPVPGETLLASQQVLLIADLSELFVETSDLTEMDVVKLSVGQAATINPDALPDVSLPASVTEIARSSGKKGGDVTYTVRLKLEKTDPRLRWGMTVEARFQ